jgi:hypothetical protein
MPRPLKIFGYTGYRREARMERNVHGQTREVIAATTQAEAFRMSGLTRSQFDQRVSECGNDEETALAMSAPGTVFWQPHNYPARTGAWVAIPPKAAE